LNTAEAQCQPAENGANSAGRPFDITTTGKALLSVRDNRW
jgi:hypothetical protein